jgi:hypothetical protein
LYRLTHSKPKAEVFFDWLDRQFQRQGFTPSNPFIKALNYVRERRLGLEVFLIDPDVPIDTNHIERALRVIPMGHGFSAGPNSAPDTSASSRVWSSPADCTASIRIPISSMCSSASQSTPHLGLPN